MIDFVEEVRVNPSIMKVNNYLKTLPVYETDGKANAEKINKVHFKETEVKDSFEGDSINEKIELEKAVRGIAKKIVEKKEKEVISADEILAARKELENMNTSEVLADEIIKDLKGGRA